MFLAENFFNVYGVVTAHAHKHIFTIVILISMYCYHDSNSNDSDSGTTTELPIPNRIRFLVSIFFCDLCIAGTDA